MSGSIIEFLFEKSETKDREIKEKCLTNLIELYKECPLEIDFNDGYVRKYIELCWDLDKLEELKETLKFKRILLKDYWIDEDDSYVNLRIDLNRISKNEWNKIKEYLEEIGLTKKEIKLIFDKELYDYIVYQNLTKSIDTRTFSYWDLEFIIEYESKSNETILFDKIKHNAPYYHTKEYSFLDPIENYLPDLFKNNEVNKQAFYEYLENVDSNIYINDELVITKEPFLDVKKSEADEKDGILKIYHLKNTLNDEEKKELIEFLFKKYEESKNKDCNRFIIKVNNEMFNFKEIFGFNPKEKVYPDEYALDEERVPKWLSKWIDGDNKKQEFLFKQFKLNTMNGSVVKLRRFFIDGKNLRKYGQVIDDISEQLLLNTLYYLSNNYKIIRNIHEKVINSICNKIKNILVDKYKNKPLFLAHKVENGKKRYSFEPLDKLLWADNKFYYEKFKDSALFLCCSVLKDEVVPISECIGDPKIKETEKEKLDKAEEPELLGYIKWKDIVEKKCNKKVSIYEVNEPIEYILYLEFNDIKKSVCVREQHYIQQSDSEIKCYVERYDTGVVSSCLEDYINKKMCELLSKIGILNDEDRIKEELQKINLTMDEQDETESEEDDEEETDSGMDEDEYGDYLDNETDEYEHKKELHGEEYTFKSNKLSTNKLNKSNDLSENLDMGLDGNYLENEEDEILKNPKSYTEKKEETTKSISTKKSPIPSGKYSQEVCSSKFPKEAYNRPRSENVIKSNECNHRNGVEHGYNSSQKAERSEEDMLMELIKKLFNKSNKRNGKINGSSTKKSPIPSGKYSQEAYSSKSPKKIYNRPRSENSSISNECNHRNGVEHGYNSSQKAERSEEDMLMELIKKLFNKSNKRNGKIENLKNEFELLDNSSKYSLEWFKKLIELEIEYSKSRFKNKSLKVVFYKVRKVSEHLLELSLSNKPIPQFIEDFPNIQIKDENGNLIEHSAISVDKNKVKVKIVKPVNKKPKKVILEIGDLSFLLETLRKEFDSLPELFDCTENEFFIKEYVERRFDKLRIIYGPPGTGKTTKLVEDILKMVDLKNKKILFLAPTNKAVDVFVKKIKDVADGKIEHLSSYKDIAKELIDNKLIVRYGSTSDEDIEELASEEINNACIVSTTIAKVSYDKKLYDYLPNILIFDECSMIPIPYIVYSICIYSSADETWISGDPNQIQPVGLSKYWKNYNIYDMFNDLLNINLYDISENYSNYFKGGYDRLNIQYRSVKPIGELFSKYTYNGILKHHRENEKPNYLSNITNSNICVIKYDVKVNDKLKDIFKIENSPINIYSATLSSELALKIKETLKEKGLKKSIGLITPYKYQAQLIDGLISNQMENEGIEIWASTVHKFQGEECDIIIVVLNPPNVDISSDSLLNNKNLLNVAISRAKDYLFILMPKGLNNTTAENLQDLYNILEKEKVNKFDDESLENILFNNSPLKERVFITTHGKINAYGKDIGVKYELKLDEKYSNKLNSIDLFVNRK